MSRLSLRIDFGDNRRLGPGKIRLLELIGEHGSISAAGRQMGMSYKRAWTLIDTLNAMFATPLVTARVGGAGGGKAELTVMGHTVVRAYRTMEEQAAAVSHQHLQTIEAQLTGN